MDNRREFLKKLGMLSGSVGMASFLPASIQKAFAIDPPPGSTWMDAEHVVILMQENRSFDHCFGTLRGVRGYNDPRAIRLANGNPVWLQSDKAGNAYAPFHLNIRDTKATWMSSLPHSWRDQVNACNDGKHDGWLDQKRSGNPEYAHMPLTMGYYTRDDIPFNYALADAFTVCDQHFCSSLTGTTPNRLYLWSGTIRAKKDQASRALVWNGDSDFESLDWTTYPERLEAAGVSWKVYQNEISVDSGLEDESDAWLSNFTDNPLEWFAQYNVRMYPRHLTYLQRLTGTLPGEIDALKKQLARAAVADQEKLKARLDEMEKQLADAQTTLAAKSGRWDSLTPFQKAIHAKGFSNNEADPDFRSLEMLNYTDGNTPRSFEVPKGDVLQQFRADVDAGKLPAVSWLVAPEHFSDHPGSAWFGSLYVSEAMDILTKNPEVWKKTIFLLTYDENDGYFDHVPPFTAPNVHRNDTGKVSPGIDARPDFVTREEALDRKGFPETFERASSIGLGFRVPLVVASPWTRGGYVNSEVFDHTSPLQFLEKFIAARTGKPVFETNITDFRRAVCGDLTSVFRPYHGEPMPRLDFLKRDPFLEGVHQAKFKGLPNNYKLFSPEESALFSQDPYASPYMAVQEKGIKPACALPYELYADARFAPHRKAIVLRFAAGNAVFGNASAGAPFKVYAPGKFVARDPDAGEKFETLREWSYAVKPGGSLEDQWSLEDFENGTGHLCVYGPNGFFREYRMGAGDPAIGVDMQYEGLSGNAALRLVNHGKKAVSVRIADNAYKQAPIEKNLPPGVPVRIPLDLSKQFGWYDCTLSAAGHEGFMQRFAGHVETGKPSMTDPFMGRMVDQ